MTKTMNAAQGQIELIRILRDFLRDYKKKSDTIKLDLVLEAIDHLESQIIPHKDVVVYLDKSKEK